MPIVGLLITQGTTTYGMTSRHVPMYLFRPMDTTLIPRRVAWKNADRLRNFWVTVEPTDEVAPIPRAILREVIGEAGNWTAERDALLWHFQGDTWPKELPEPETPHERILLDMPTVHIDPPGCRDIDDAISIRGDTYAISIADVYAWVRLNPWMIAAQYLGQTLYSGGLAQRPMFPPKLSEDRMSLLPNQRRPAVVLTFTFNNDKISNAHISFRDVVVHGSYTYGTAHNIKEFPVEKLKAIASHLVKHETDDPHEWVEALMVFYNTTVAQLLVKHGVGLLRTQSEPDREKLERFSAVCPESAILAMRAAEYVPATDVRPHFGMRGVYTHATSPIRRWADVVNQSVLHGTPLDVNIAGLNAREKHIKKFVREIFFIDALEAPQMPLDAVVVEVGRLFVPHWRRAVKVNREDLAVGEKVKIRYHLDMNKPTWKRRMVVEVV